MKKIIEQYKISLTFLLFLFASVLAIYFTGLNGHIWSFLGMNNDGRFHIMRMEGLYESMRRGVFFPVVNMSMMDGFGYISNVFYSNLWLYPVALLRLAGLSIIDSFIIFYVLLNFCTFVISFGTFYQASHRYNKSLIFSFVYTLSIYRLFDMVRRFDVGEILTLTFLPLVLLGVYEIFYANDKKWLYLTLGMTAIIYSHALSPILIAIFILWVILFRIKALIKEPRRILSLLYASLVSLALSLAYFLPMIEQMKHTQFKLTNAPLVYISQGGTSLQAIFSRSVANDLYIQNIGFVILLMAFTIPFTIWKVKNPAVRDFAIIGEILLFMTTNIFPWKFFNKTPLNMVQFPWRFFMLITILFAIYLASDPLNWFRSGWQTAILICLILGIVVGAERSLVKNHPYEYDTYTAFDDLDVYSIGAGQEYLPKNASLPALRKTPHVPQVESGSATIDGFKQVGSKLSFNFKNAQNAKIDVPIIGYYGYSAKESVGKVSAFKMDTKNNGLGQVEVRGSGTVKINYYNTGVQKISKIISIISLVILLFVIILRKKIKNRVSLTGK